MPSMFLSADAHLEGHKGIVISQDEQEGKGLSALNCSCPRAGVVTRGEGHGKRAGPACRLEPAGV